MRAQSAAISTLSAATPLGMRLSRIKPVLDAVRVRGNVTLVLTSPITTTVHERAPELRAARAAADRRR
jgi:hypothetical protein